MRYKITIEYDGTNYVGWQSQKDQPNKSIEEILQNAIYELTFEKVKINCAGRTDAGVHAIAQIADFYLEKNFKPHQILMGVNNKLLENNIAIIDCEIVDDNFHSRYNAKLRTYHYKILNRKTRPILQKNRVFHFPTKLDVQKMQEAAQFLIGTHDFTSFQDSKCQSLSPIKTVKSVNFFQKNQEIIIKISAKSFLHHMVRNIIGTLILVGQEKISPQDFLEILKSKDRTKSGFNAPSCGLYFFCAKY